MSFSEYGNYDGLGLAELVRKKKVTPAELVEEAIQRIETHNPKLNTVINYPGIWPDALYRIRNLWPSTQPLGYRAHARWLIRRIRRKKT